MRTMDQKKMMKNSDHIYYESSQTPLNVGIKELGLLDTKNR